MSAAVASHAIEDFLRARARHPALTRAVWCGRALPGTVLGDGQFLRDAAKGMRPEIRTAFLRWVTSQGPFLDDARAAFDDDLFFCGHDEVTDGGIGEAARQMLLNCDAGVISLAALAGNRFSGSPLSVLQGFADNPIRWLDILNCLDPADAVQLIFGALPEPTRWADLLAQCRERFASLTISPHCETVLSRYPFEATVARRTVELLGVLQHLVDEIDPATGALSAVGRELQQQYFVGQKAWFSDAGDEEKAHFRNEMTFPNPEAGEPITCFWHGKIKWPQYRIHFQWPVSTLRNKLLIAYIGPKISKS
ncbi:hypothetical protein KZX46_21570 (plasmid) [Polymorphobacter sp. PAMC 29334]|uniref:hypothetical protein n=1 Tax=Polymorphobacter sp. PAMC 29334 TaxID=2862331 RepID=UPI001C773128|nr:hypothetical protein [Polymorphobacter sp. PAMC 29334]QYE37226.1 hypothetical protein KZX46_21570 [Polymorphobacter sp. PAMC 29334]